MILAPNPEQAQGIEFHLQEISSQINTLRAKIA